ncbi:MAG TPA: hypothetical protein VG652_03200 [Gaiellaceae bacterium]|nr:hypothetical protein [Gaiellaceae bacterium]
MTLHIRPRPHLSRFDERREHNEIELELQHIRDLVKLRSIFERHGVTREELLNYDAEIERHRRDLAVIAGRHAGQHLTAA